MFLTGDFDLTDKSFLSLFFVIWEYTRLVIYLTIKFFENAATNILYFIPIKSIKITLNWEFK